RRWKSTRGSGMPRLLRYSRMRGGRASWYSFAALRSCWFSMPRASGIQRAKKRRHALPEAAAGYVVLAASGTLVTLGEDTHSQHAVIMEDSLSTAVDSPIS